MNPLSPGYPLPNRRPGPVTFVWVRGHRGDQFNERADELAGIAAREVRDGAPANAAPVVPTPVSKTAAAPVPESDVLF